VDTQEKYVIVGGGVAGVEAAKALRKRDGTGSITIVSMEDCLPYNRPVLSRVLAKDTFFEEILLETDGFYKQHNIRLLKGVQDLSIETTGKTLVLSNGEELSYTKLLLATGANPLNPIKMGEGGVPVCVLRSFVDAKELVRAAAGKRVVLVGGGILGLEAAVALQGRGCAVTVVELAPRLMSLQADEEASRRLQKALNSMGIETCCGLSVQSTDTGGAVLSDGSHLECDLVLASMGVRSEASLAAAAGLKVGRGIVVDDTMHTSGPDIWAAGDCAEYDGRVAATAGEAAAMGEVAGASMTGDTGLRYNPIVPATSFACLGFAMLSVGDVLRAGEDAVYNNEGIGGYRRLVLQNGRLVGALFVGETNPGAKAVQAVEQNQPLAEAAHLLAPE
jgi:NAD(P)H-nitrite reductase large subunit